MQLDNKAQLLSLLIFTMLGGGLGTVYCALSPIRRDTSRRSAFAADVLFSLFSGIFIFLCTMLPVCGGEGGIWELSAAAMGFAALLLLCGDKIANTFQIIHKTKSNARKNLKKNLKKLLIFIKLYFTNLK